MAEFAPEPAECFFLTPVIESEQRVGDLVLSGFP